MFILLNKVRVGNIKTDVEKLLKARFIHESDKSYPRNALDMYAEIAPAVKRNEVVLNDLPGEFYTIEASYKIPDNCKYLETLIQAAQNQKQTKTEGLAKLLKLKNVGAKVILNKDGLLEYEYLKKLIYFP